MPRHRNNREVILDKEQIGELDFIKPQERKRLNCKTENHRLYLKSIEENVITVCSGPAGTGKTFISVGFAAQRLLLPVGHTKRLEKLIIARPTIEAGPSLGFLPGDLNEKSEPFMRPVIDALKEFMSYEEIKRMREELRIEVIPLQFMRGLTFRGAIVVLDESQNACKQDFKMFCSRIGENTKLVINGDPKQVDIQDSGFDWLCRVFSRKENIGIINMTREDNMRHPIVERVLSYMEDSYEH